MKDWENVKLGSVCEVVRGGSPRPIIDYITNEPEGVNWLKIGDVKETDKFFTHANEKIKPSGILKTREVKAGDLILSNSMSFGRAFITLIDGYIHDGWLRLRCDEGRLDKEYLYYFLTSCLAQNQFKAIATGSVVNNLKSDTVKAIKIDLPTLGEQKRIAEVLSIFDDKIKCNEEINENLLQQAIALYEHLLQEAEWPTATILDVAKKVAMGPFGSNIKVSTFVPKGVPIISGNHLRGYFLEEPEFNYITEEHAERLKNSIVFPHDLIFTHAGNIGQVAMIPDRCKYDRYVLSQRQFYLRCDETKVVPEFLLLFFHSASGQHELLSYANQTGVPSIAQPASNLKKIPFKCPPMQEQLMWQEQVHPLLGQYLNNRLENERLSSLRDILLPKLMSGELDVSDLDL